MRTATPRLLDTFDSRLRLEGAVVPWTGLHIGAGGSGDPLATDLPVVRDAAGRPYIPGSSLKGVLRSAAEALFRDCGLTLPDGERLWACNPMAGKSGVCVDHDRHEEIRKELTPDGDPEPPDPRRVAVRVWEESCTVCRLFGSSALAGRVRFPDLPLAGDHPGFEVRNGVGIDRDRELAVSGVLYDLEAVPGDARFALTVVVDNPTDEEIGLLLYLFEELDAGNLALGGNTSRGLGRVRVAWDRFDETSLEHGNPFAELLSSRDLLRPEPDAADPDAEPGQSAEDAADATTDDVKVPATGDPEAWRTLIRLVRELPRIDKGLLGQAGSEHGLTKQTLNEKLGLGLEGKDNRKAWDVALDRLVDVGVLERDADGHPCLPGQAAEPEADDAEAAPPARDPELQRLYDRFIGAIARLWEEAR